MFDVKLKKGVVVQSLIVNIIVLFLLTGTFFFYFYGNIKLVEGRKESLLNTYNELKTYAKVGITHGDFIALYEGVEHDNSYVETIIKTMSEEFYKKKLMNADEKEESFDEFVRKKRIEIDEVQASNRLNENIAIVDRVIPIYSDQTSLTLSGNILNDFKFINYIENITHIFNLKSSDVIEAAPPALASEVSAINPEVLEGSSDTIEGGIYYIPFTFVLSGAKENIIDFLHYAQFVGSMKIEEGVIKVHNDNTLSHMKGDTNIYESQVFDINEITFDENLMSPVFHQKYKESRDGDLIEYIKATQGTDDYKLKMDVRFYVRGLPTYQVRTFIEEQIARYDQLKSDILSLLSEVNNLQVYENSELMMMGNTLRSIAFDLNMLEEKITGIRTAYTSSDIASLGEAYSEMRQLSVDFDEYQKNLEANKLKVEAEKQKLTQ